MKKSQLTIVVVFSVLILLLIAFTLYKRSSTVPTPQQEITNANYTVRYHNGILYYTAKVVKPTPCDGIDVQEQLFKTYPPEVVIRLKIVPPPKGVYCIQILKEETIERNITTEQQLARFTIYLNDELVFAKNDIIPS